MLKRTTLTMAIAAILAVPTIAQAEIEVTTVVKNETAFFTTNGQVTADAKNEADTGGHSQGATLKFENSAKFFLNGDLGEDSSWHGEFNIIYDTAGVNNDYQGHNDYSQNDWFRELYIDTSIGENLDLRIGKQQVVWGTADGIKLLDIINPTDFREFNQNTTEDARIPVWMINAELAVGETGSAQFVLYENETNKLAGFNEEDIEGTYQVTGTDPFVSQMATSVSNAGLSDGVDRGQAFVFRGVETITGRTNGFLNIGAAFGGVANTFNFLSAGGGNVLGLTVFGGATVDNFATNDAAAINFRPACGGMMSPLTPQGLAPGDGSASSSACLDALTQLSNDNITNVIDTQTIDTPGTQAGASVEWDTANANSAFEYVSNTTFATFDSFVNMKTQYKRDTPDDLDANFAMRFRDSTEGGSNYSINYAYAYDSNPYVELSWQATDGTALTSSVGNAAHNALYNNTNTVTLQDANGNQRCSANGGENGCTLLFTEKVGRVHNLGSSFDTAFQAGEVPLVLRGEFLYQKDVQTPVVDRGELSIGNLTEALTSKEADYFKYVIGLDATVLTNLLVSGQFIQFRNLDYIDKASSRLAGFEKYTGDQANLSLSNGLQKAEENKEFYSLFLSKPFGPEQQGRVNNITIAEEGGGYWNRLDAEYGLTDQLIVSGEINTYWGDENTTFGQFSESSNLQLGVKYIFEN